MTPRSALLPIVASLGIWCCIPSQGQSVAGLGPAAYRSHFAPNAGASADSGSRDGWESYPIVEDAGYDPTLLIETSQGRSSLLRVTVPTRDGRLQAGFIKRIQMVTGEGASFSVRVRVPDAASSTSIRLSLFRGAKEEKHNAIVADGQWHTLRFVLPPSPDSITALAIAADLPHAVAGRMERFSIQDARLTALAVRHLTLREPVALWDPNRSLYYLQRSIRSGEDLHLLMDTQDKATLHWSLVSPDGSVAAKGEGREVNRHFSSTDAPGLWTLHMTSATSETTALLLVRPSRNKKLLFDQAPSLAPELLQAVRKRRDLLRTTTRGAMGSNIAQMNPDAILPGLPSYFSILTQAPELAMLDAIDFRNTGDIAARDESRKLLAEIAHWPLWVHPWFPAHGYHSYYPVGMMTKFVVMAEQFLGDDLSETDRKQIDRSLLNLSIRPIYEEYVLEDRLQFNTSNWIGNTAGGALLAALASDDPDTAGYALGLFIKERDHVREAYTSDGSYGESTSYQKFDLEMTTLAAAASKRQLGQSFDANLMPAERYLRYAAYGNEDLLDYGDSHVAIRPSNVLAYLASLNQSDRLTEFYFKYLKEDAAELLSRVLWEGSIHRVAVPPANDAASALFEQRGIAILRDDWSDHSSVIAMRAGKNFNHNHADEGSVFFARNGKLWLGEAGYADYYKDPAYPTFNVQAVGHNTLLIDGDPESQILPGNAVFGTSPSMVHHLMNGKISLVEADLTSAYAAKLGRYTRTLFYQKNGPLIVIDRIAADAPHTYTQVWHPKQRIDKVDAHAHRFRLTDDVHHLSVQTFADAGLTITQRESPLPLTSYEQAEREAITRPARFEITTNKAERTMDLVTVVQPESDTSRAEATWKREDGAEVLVVGDTSVELRGGGIVTRWDEDAAGLHVTQYRDRKTGGMLRFSKPVDLQASRRPDGTIALEIDADTATEFHMEGFTVEGPVNAIRAGHNSLVLR